MAELKPCPFCGGTEIEFEPAWFNGIGIFPPRIGCPKCDYTIQGKVGFIGKRTETKVKYSNNLLVNWWNRRYANSDGRDGQDGSDGQRGKKKDGKQPRYCRMAQDIDRMAEEMLFMGYDKAGCEGWVFRDKLYYDKDKAIEAAKSWLMECEGGNE